nr:transposase [Biomphalaria glabrata]
MESPIGLYQHNVVNHRMHFVDPATDPTTNHVEKMWKSMKQKLKWMSRTSDDLMQSHIDEFLWRRRRGKTSDGAFNSILWDIATFYPVPFLHTNMVWFDNARISQRRVGNLVSLDYSPRNNIMATDLDISRKTC